MEMQTLRFPISLYLSLFWERGPLGTVVVYALCTSESDEAGNPWRGPGIWVLVERQENELTHDVR